MSKTSIPIFSISKKNSIFRQLSYKKQSRDEVQESYSWPSLSTTKVPATDLKGNELFKVSSNSTTDYCEKVKSALEGKNESKLKIKLNGPISNHYDDVANHNQHTDSLLNELRGSSCKVLVLNPYAFGCISNRRNFLSFNELEISEKNHKHLYDFFRRNFQSIVNLLSEKKARLAKSNVDVLKKLVDTETDVVFKKQVSEWLTSQQSDRPVVEHTTTDKDSKKTVKKSSPLNNSQLRRENVDQLSVKIDRQQEAHLYNVYTKKEPSKASKNSFQENPLRLGGASPSKKVTNSPRGLIEGSKQSSKENKPNHQTSESNKMNEKHQNQPELVHKKLGLTTKKYTKKFSAGILRAKSADFEHSRLKKQKKPIQNQTGLKRAQTSDAYDTSLDLISSLKSFKKEKASRRKEIRVAIETQERYKEIEKELSTPLDLTKRPTLKVNIRTTDESLKLILTEFKDKKERCQKRINHLISLEGIKACLKQEKPKLLNEIDEYFLNSKCLKQLKENNKRYCEYLEYFEKFIADLEAVRIKLWDKKFKDIHTKYEELQKVSINNSSSVSYDSTSLESLNIAISTIEKTIKTEELNVDKIKELNAKIKSLELELDGFDQSSFSSSQNESFQNSKKIYTKAVIDYSNFIENKKKLLESLLSKKKVLSMRLDRMSFNVKQSIQNSVEYQNLKKEVINNLDLVDISIDLDKVADESFINEKITEFKIVKSKCNEKINALKKVKEEFFKSIQDLKNKKPEYETEINNYCLTCRFLTLSNQQFKEYSDYSERCNTYIQLLREKKLAVQIKKAIENSNDYQNLKTEMGCSLVLFKIPDGHNLTKTLYNQRNSRSKSLQDFIEIPEQCHTKIERLKTLKQKLITSIRDFINENLKHEEQIRNYCSTCELLRSCNKELEKYSNYLERCNTFIQVLKKKKSSRTTNYNRHNRSVTNNAGQQGKTPVKTDYKDDTILSTTREGVWERSVHV